MIGIISLPHNLHPPHRPQGNYDFQMENSLGLQYALHLDGGHEFVAVVDIQTARSCFWLPFEKSSEQPKAIQN